MIRTIQDMQNKLRGGGGLSDLIKPEDFCPEGAVADKIGGVRELKSSQLRRIFGTIRLLERRNRGEALRDVLKDPYKQRLALLGPELAYARGRNLIPRDFYQMLRSCLEPGHMRTVADLRRLGELLAAVVAYQKMHNPKS